MNTLGDTPAAAAKDMAPKLRAFLVDPTDEAKRKEAHVALLRYESVSYLTDGELP